MSSPADLAWRRASIVLKWVALVAMHFFVGSFFSALATFALIGWYTDK